ncbi:MAG: redoxin domain-containing protein [Patescibacteria group bacterium]
MLLNNLKNMINDKIKGIGLVGLIAIALVVLGLALLNTSKTSEQEQKAITSTNSLIGKPLPDMQLRDNTGNVYDFSSLKGKNAVLFFNEGLMCYPACWDQMAAFGTDNRFNSDDIIADSVVADSVADWQKAIDKMPDLAKVTTLFDQDAISSRQLGIVSMGSSMHAGQLPGHTYIMIDKQGIVRDVFDDANMAINNDKLFEMISKY